MSAIASNSYVFYTTRLPDILWATRNIQTRHNEEPERMATALLTTKNQAKQDYQTDYRNFYTKIQHEVTSYYQNIQIRSTFF